MNKKPNIPPLYYPLWLLLKSLSLLPLPVLYVLSDFFYLLVYHLIGYRKKVVWQNMRNSFPEKGEQEIARLAKAFYRQFADLVVEILKLRTMSADEMRRRIVFSNQEVLDQFVRQGTPVITMGSHSGNWEWVLSAGAVQFGFPAEGIYKPLHNAFFEEYMLSTRTRLGARLIKMKDTMRDFVRNRKVPRVIAMLSDQTPPYGEIQYWTTFMNQETAFFVGAEKLANTFGYPVLFLDVDRIARGRYHLRFEVLSDGKTKPDLPGCEYPITEAFARTLEKSIQRSPANYLWTHRRWKHKRPVAN
ncbi:lysophospholipid acyltransferase family protein [Pontibacter qinzhouensis]|uniref:Lysophospholipid acyltransferase family protein n=1 Tax=Pontibacter qinzhouensis TaxID=2603253 RepID=A0A5C8J2W2_9BACT|nr:lysophospholipid acyltransferase family protein [Pontibacter qinzhouensis]TXK28430.1 lysophospholipid acyltransferase family protein [Pontibacter qinzhouensis]